jgi:small Trp-rich protein
MFFVLLGVLLEAMKLLEIGPVAAWSWWIVHAPFACAVAWWAFADGSGLTARRQSEKVDERARDRRQRNLEAMGLADKRRR